MSTRTLRPGVKKGFFIAISILAIICVNSMLAEKSRVNRLTAIAMDEACSEVLGTDNKDFLECIVMQMQMTNRQLRSRKH